MKDFDPCGTLLYLFTSLIVEVHSAYSEFLVFAMLMKLVQSITLGQKLHHDFASANQVKEFSLISPRNDMFTLGALRSIKSIHSGELDCVKERVI